MEIHTISIFPFYTLKKNCKPRWHYIFFEIILPNVKPLHINVVEALKEIREKVKV